MAMVTCILFAFVCSLALSIVAFMVGRCGRRLPIDGMLPRAVHSARWGSEDDRARATPDATRPKWPNAS
jgi:hypothetical protein